MIIIDTNIHNSFYSYLTPNNNYDCGLIFGLKNLNDSLFEKDNYYFFLINKKGYLILSKVFNGKYSEIIEEKSDEIYEKFDKRNTYKITIKYIPYIGKIIASINIKRQIAIIK
jgi:hypothetical protein